MEALHKSPDCQEAHKGRGHESSNTVQSKKDRKRENLEGGKCNVSIEAINTPQEYIDQEHLSHRPFDVKPTAADLL